MKWKDFLQIFVHTGLVYSRDRIVIYLSQEEMQIALVERVSDIEGYWNKTNNLF